MEADEVTVVFAADNAYSRPLTTAARSVIATLAPVHRLRLCVLDMGIDAQNRAAMESTFENERVELLWVDSLRDRVVDLPNTWTAITRATYGRLFIPEVLPGSVERALYLDCDVMARRSVGDLFFADMNENAALATYDVQSPFVSTVSAVPLWFDAGRSADDPNFNAGVMLMDLAAWRSDDLSGEALRYLTDGRHHFAQDQEAINVVLAGRIGQMDPRWNQQAEIFWAEHAVTQPYGSDFLALVRADPWIVHFSNSSKPWNYGVEHPFLDEWYANLDQTAYAGWRPHGPTRKQRIVKRGAGFARSVGRRVGLLASGESA